jgi:transcription elongation factor GreB
MARHKHSPPKRSAYITPEGAARLREELVYLWRVKRPQVTQAVSEAAALGDRSENAEYIYGKKQLREIDHRIHFLQKRLDELVIVDRVPQDKSRIFFGAWIRLKNDSGEEQRFRIVGADEFDIDKGLLSIDSPLARELLMKTVNDEVTVSVPRGQIIYSILEIRYSQFDITE